MKQFSFIIRVIGAISMVVSMGLLIGGYHEYGINIMLFSILCTFITLGFHLSNVYHNYFLSRRRE